MPKNPYALITPKKPAAVKTAREVEETPPTFMLGDDSEPIDQSSLAMYQVNVRLDIKSADREFTVGAIGLHVVPIIRLLYPDGEVKIDPKWAPGLPRMKAYSKGDLARHVAHLRETYTIRTREKGDIDLVSKIYGEGRNFEMFGKMKEMLELYLALEKNLRTKLVPTLRANAAKAGEALRDWQIQIAVHDAILDTDLEAIAAIASPDEDVLAGVNMEGIEVGDEIFSPTIDNGAGPGEGPTVVRGKPAASRKAKAEPAPTPITGKAKASAPVATTGRLSGPKGKPVGQGRVLLDVQGEGQGDMDPTQALVEHMRGAGFSEQTALEFAAAAAESPKAIKAKALNGITGLNTKSQVDRALVAWNEFKAKQSEPISA